MKKIMTITMHELGILFGSPIAYIVLAIYVALASWFFTSSVFIEDIASLRSFLGIMPFIMLFILPAIAMRSFAEERKSGTLDLLITLPIKDWEIVIGKYLGLLAFWGIALFSTILIPITLIALGDPDNGLLVAGYLATFLTGAVMLAIGLACSILTENQIVAFVTAVAACFVLIMLGQQVVLSAVSPFIGVFLERLAILPHYNAVITGIIDIRDVYYFLAMIGVPLTFIVTVLESRKWR